jgi:flagellar motor switch protein FliM
MTAPQTKLRMQQILASIGTASEPAPPSTDAVEYNWHQPHCFNLQQLEMLDDFYKLLAQNISEKLSKLYHTDFQLQYKSATLHFANQLIAPEQTKENFFLTFAPDNQPFGMIQISAATAAALVAKLLGENNPQLEKDKQLSQLELSLLSDFASALIDPVSGAFSREDLKPLGSICADEIPADLPDTEEICKITLADQNNENSQIHLLLLCKNLEDQLGKTQNKQKPPTPD